VPVSRALRQIKPSRPLGVSFRGLSGEACVACSAGSFLHAFDASDWTAGAPGTFSYRRCGGCGTVSLDPQPDDATLAIAYGEGYGPHNPRSVVRRLGERLGQGEAKRLVALADASGPLLDVGCGTGTFLQRLRRAGWKGPMRAIEPDPAAAAVARDALGVPIAVSTLEAAELEPESARTIVIRHVIEHLRDPKAALERARIALQSEGVLYLATPDARALAARVFGRFWRGYDPPRHLFAFTSDGVRHLLARAGFTLVTETWQFSPEFWTGSLREALDRGRGSRSARIVGHDLNPVVAVPAALAAGLEVAVHRSTMYAATAKVVF
jgi:SAM-dependent methyltransferase